jgi:hypothetical protein
MLGENEKKVSGDCTENDICSCGLPARCCQPAVAGGVYSLIFLTVFYSSLFWLKTL